MNLMDLFVKISVDDQASSKISNITSAIGHGLSSAASIGTSAVSGTAKVIGTTLANAAKVGAVALGAISTAVIKLGKDAVESYADYEQLAGGVETLFKDSADTVKQYASEAYRTSGLSANAYMETITGFSAALLRSVEGDTKRAAQLANMAITDMSDNANKMGVSLESLQFAYTGFSRGNFTMLDNLALGFSGTKQGMQELLETARELSGVEYDIESYADIVEAIHVIQTEMGITGTTAQEASKTISGSANAMKSSWKNLMTAIASGNRDTVKRSISDFSTSLRNFADNLLPRISIVLEGIGDLIEEASPVISDGLDVLFGAFFDFLPKLAKIGEDAISSLVDSIYENRSEIQTAVEGIFGAIVGFITNETPKLIQLGADMILSLVDGFASDPQGVIKAVSNAMNSILDTVLDFTIKMQEPGNKIMEELANGFDLYDMANKIGQIIANIVLFLSDNAPLIVDMGFELLGGLISGLTAEGNVERFVANITKLIQYLGQKIIDNKEEIVGSAIEILERFASAIEENKTISAIINAISSVVLAIVGELTTKENLDKVSNVGSDVVGALGAGISASASNIVEYLPDLLGNIVGYILSEDFLSLIFDCGVAIGKSLVAAIGTTVTQWFINDFGPLIQNVFGESGISFIDELQENVNYWKNTGNFWGDKPMYGPDQLEMWEKEKESGLTTEHFMMSSGYIQGYVSINQNIYSEAQTAADLMEEAMLAQERALMLG